MILSVEIVSRMGLLCSTQHIVLGVVYKSATHCKMNLISGYLSACMNDVAVIIFVSLLLSHCQGVRTLAWASLFRRNQITPAAKQARVMVVTEQQRCPCPKLFQLSQPNMVPVLGENCPERGKLHASTLTSKRGYSLFVAPGKLASPRKTKCFYFVAA